MNEEIKDVAFRGRKKRGGKKRSKKMREEY